MPAQTATGLTLAVLANRKIRGRTFFRTAFYFPSISSSVVISIIFLWMYSARGPINFVLRELGVADAAAGLAGQSQRRDRARRSAASGSTSVPTLARRAERRPALDHDAQRLDDDRHDDGHLPGRAAEHPRRRLRGGRARRRHPLPHVPRHHGAAAEAGDRRSSSRSA